jgi:HK97 family phage major capsid protein
VDPTAQAAAQLAEAEKIVTGAGDRPLTSDELNQVEGHLTKAEGLRQSVELTKRIDDLNGGLTGVKPGVVVGSDGGSIGDVIVGAYADRKSMGGGGWTTGEVELPGIDYRGLGQKATVSETASPVITPDFQAGVLETLFRRLTVQDLLATGTTGSNQVTYAQETTATNAAAAVAEEAAKPESTLILALVNEPVRKVATFLPVSDEMLEDLAQARSYLDSRLRMFVSHAMEAQLLNGSGTAPNIRGILNRTGVQTVVTTAGLTADKAIVAVYDAVTLIRTVAFMEPDAVVIHPTNWSLIRLAKDTNGQYFGGGPFVGPYGVGAIARESLWGLPVVVTSAIAAGTVLVGAFRTAGQTFFRSGLTVEASNSHSDFFQKDITALRAEQRAALAVYRPAGFAKITLTA